MAAEASTLPESPTQPEPDAAPARGPLRLSDLVDDLQAGREVFFRHVSQVGDLMQPLAYLELEHKIADGLQFFEKHSCRHVVLVEAEAEGDNEKRLVLIGIVSQRDVFRSLSAGFGTLGQTEEDEAMLKQPLSAIVTRKPRTVSPTTPLVEAVGLMVAEKIDCLPVCEPGHVPRPIGVLTTSDIVRCFPRMRVLRRARAIAVRPARVIDFVSGGGGSGGQPSDVVVESMMGKAADVMVRDVVTVTATDPLRKVVEIMATKRIRHTAVLGTDGRPVGLVSDRDVLRHLPPPSKKGPAADRGGSGGFRDKLFDVDPTDARSAQALDAEISSVMQAPPPAFGPSTPFAEIAERMLATKSDGALVVDEGSGELVGIVTETDALHAMLMLARLVDA